MLDILVVSHPCFNSVNREYYRRLRDLGYQLELVVPKSLTFPSGKRNAHPVQDNDPPINFLDLKGKNPRIQQFIGLDKLLNSKKPKLVFLDNAPGSLMALKIGRWCKKTGAKYICQSNENLSFDLISSFRRQGVKGLLLSVFRNTCLFLNRSNVNHLFTINNDGTNLYKDFGFESVSKIPLGFNEQIFRNDPTARQLIRKKLGLKGITIAYFGRITFEKGIHVLLKALSRIKDLEWHFLMDEFDLYATRYSQEIKTTINNLGLNDRIIYFDANHLEIANYMNASDIVVLASVSTPKWKEQYGRVVPESMACKNLVVASNSGAIPELLGNTGLLIEENDDQKLAEILKIAVLKYEQFEEVIQKAYERAMTHLGIDAQVQMTNKVLKKLLLSE